MEPLLILIGLASASALLIRDVRRKNYPTAMLCGTMVVAICGLVALRERSNERERRVSLVLFAHDIDKSLVAQTPGSIGAALRRFIGGFDGSRHQSDQEWGLIEIKLQDELGLLQHTDAPGGEAQPDAARGPGTAGAAPGQ